MEQITLKIARFTANNTLEKPYRGAYLLEDDEIVNLLKIKFEPISEDRLCEFFKKKGE